MHVPDGFLDARTLAATAGLAVVGLGLALREVRRNLPPRRVPLIGLAAAFVFAAQMLNFPVAAGTSGHLIGAALAAVLLGPAAAIVAMTAVLLLQALMFADGGITALGANVLNLAVIAPLAAHGVVTGGANQGKGARAGPGHNSVYRGQYSADSTHCDGVGLWSQVGIGVEPCGGFGRERAYSLNVSGTMDPAHLFRCRITRRNRNKPRHETPSAQAAGDRFQSTPVLGVVWLIVQ